MTPNGFTSGEQNHRGEHPRLTEKQAKFLSFPDEDVTSHPGDFQHPAGKTSGGTCPLPVPPILTPDEPVGVERQFHHYVRGLFVGNISYTNVWGHVYTWLIESCRLNHLCLTKINTNPDLRGRAFFVHLVFATRAMAQTAKGFFNESHPHLSNNGPNSHGLVADSINAAKQRKLHGAW